jgi:hypothetical protein
MKDDLTTMPGIGKSLAQDLRNIGIHSVAELKGMKPEDIYDRSNKYAGCVQDPCVLYAFRCAVYFSEGGREPEKLKWWNWKKPS